MLKRGKVLQTRRRKNFEIKGGFSRGFPLNGCRAEPCIVCPKPPALFFCAAQNKKQEGKQSAFRPRSGQSEVKNQKALKAFCFSSMKSHLWGEFERVEHQGHRPQQRKQKKAGNKKEIGKRLARIQFLFCRLLFCAGAV